MHTLILRCRVLQQQIWFYWVKEMRGKFNDIFTDILQNFYFILKIYSKLFFNFFFFWLGDPAPSLTSQQHTVNLLFHSILSLGQPVPQCPDCGDTLSTQTGSGSNWLQAMESQPSSGVSKLMCRKKCKTCL